MAVGKGPVRTMKIHISIVRDVMCVVRETCVHTQFDALDNAPVLEEKNLVKYFGGPYDCASAP